jgi:broad specificity phosphatase PhoE
LTEELTKIPFWFLRHGETDWNAQGLSQGQVEVPLNANGRAQAAACAEKFLGRGIASIVCSPLGRAQETARIVAGVLKLEFSTEPDLREASFGDQEGKPMGPWYDEWVQGSFTPPGGETFAALRARVVVALNRSLTQPAPVLVVAHGAMFRAAVRTDNGVPMWCEPGEPWELRGV